MARRLLHLPRAGMLVLLDRAFDANAFLRQVAATGALLLARAKSTRRDTVLNAHLRGAFLMSRSVQKHMVDQRYGRRPTCGLAAGLPAGPVLDQRVSLSWAKNSVSA